jgi:hypothetical protein
VLVQCHVMSAACAIPLVASAGQGALVLHLILPSTNASPLGGSPSVSVVATSASEVLVLIAAGSRVQVPTGAVARSGPLSSGRTCGRTLAFSVASGTCAVIGDGSFDKSSPDTDNICESAQPAIALYDLRGRSPKLIRRFRGQAPGNLESIQIGGGWHAKLSPDAAYRAIFIPGSGGHIVSTSTGSCRTILRPDAQSQNEISSTSQTTRADLIKSHKDCRLPALCGRDSRGQCCFGQMGPYLWLT